MLEFCPFLTFSFIFLHRRLNVDRDKEEGLNGHFLALPSGGPGQGAHYLCGVPHQRATAHVRSVSTPLLS